MEWCILIPESVISEIKYRSNIEQLIGEYVQLKKRGTTLIGLCPFHSEKTPSFTVWPQKGSYYCFGCGKGGDAITFVRDVENLDYIEAVKFLAKRAGIIIPESEADAGDSRLRLRLLELNRFAARFFHEKLYSPEGETAMKYLKSRRFSDKTIKTFGIGYSPNGWTELTDAARQAGFSDSELTAAFLAAKGKNGGVYDIFRNRVMFPLIDPNGKGVVAFAGRRIADSDSDRKYVNTNDTPVFKKSRFLFGLNLAKKTKAGYFIITEGPTDTISLHQAGFTQAIASQGTALTEEHARMIARYVQNVVLCYDGDAAGQAAAQRAFLKLREAGLSVKILEIVGAKDPDEYIKLYGPERFSALIEGSSDAISYRLRGILAGYDISQPDRKTKCLTEMLKLLAGIDNQIEREVYVGNVSKMTGISRDSILTELKKLLASKTRRDARDEVRRVVIPRQAGEHGEPVQTPLSRNCAALVRFAADFPDSADAVAALLPDGKLPDPFWNRLLDFIRAHGSADDLLAVMGAELTTSQVGLAAGMLNGIAGCTNLDEAKKYVEAIKAELDQ